MTAQRCDVLGGIYARLGVIAGDVTGIEVLRPCMRYLVEQIGASDRTHPHLPRVVYGIAAHAQVVSAWCWHGSSWCHAATERVVGLAAPTLARAPVAGVIWRVLDGLGWYPSGRGWPSECAPARPVLVNTVAAPMAALGKVHGWRGGAGR
jgi:hypothetical protein